MLKPTLASLVLATSLFACKDAPPQVIAVPAPAADVQHPGQMTVTGTATLQVSPDCADLTMTISADAVRPGTSTSTVTKREQGLLSALGELGVETSDIKLSHLRLDPIYAPNPDGWSTLKVATYRAQVTVTVTTKKFDQIAAIMEAGANAGATSLSSKFRRSDMPELKAKVRDMALVAAKAKAEQTAKALGIDLGHVVSVSEASAGMMWQSAYFPQVSNAMERNAPSGNIAIGGELQPLTLTITVGYELPRTT